MDNNNFLHSNKKKMFDVLIQNKKTIDYKDVDMLKKFIASDGKILPCRRTGLITKNQRKIQREIKRARCISLMPFKNEES